LDDVLNQGKFGKVSNDTIKDTLNDTIKLSEQESKILKQNEKIKIIVVDNFKHFFWQKLPRDCPENDVIAQRNGKKCPENVLRLPSDCPENRLKCYSKCITI
jgi:hypothetical protein